MSCSAGPWKGLWVRRGYDPRLHPAARKWQALEFPVPHAWCAQECCLGLPCSQNGAAPQPGVMNAPPKTCWTCFPLHGWAAGVPVYEQCLKANTSAPSQRSLSKHACCDAGDSAWRRSSALAAGMPWTQPQAQDWLPGRVMARRCRQRQRLTYTGRSLDAPHSAAAQHAMCS